MNSMSIPLGGVSGNKLKLLLQKREGKDTWHEGRHSQRVATKGNAACAHWGPVLGTPKCLLLERLADLKGLLCVYVRHFIR